MAQDHNAISDGQLSDAPGCGYGSDKSLGHRPGEWRGDESRRAAESAFSSSVGLLAMPRGAMRLAGEATYGKPDSAEMLDLGLPSQLGLPSSTLYAILASVIVTHATIERLPPVSIVVPRIWCFVQNSAPASEHQNALPTIPQPPLPPSSIPCLGASSRPTPSPLRCSSSLSCHGIFPSCSAWGG